MDSHPLNLAHQQHRRAEAHLTNNRYDEAMQCHHNAAELLLDALKSTDSSVALESITLQHSYHLKQKDLIKSKKEQYARVRKAMDNIKWLVKEPLSSLQGHEYAKLQVAIYKAINETDSLLLTLLNKKDGIEVGLLRDTVTRDVIDGKRTEKSQETVVEELQILSQNLHSLVEQLVLQVEVLKDENMTLKERVNYLEKERIKYLNLPTPTKDLQHNFSIMSITNEGYLKDNDQRTLSSNVPQESRPTNPGNAMERLNQQPLFDLSALKDN